MLLRAKAIAQSQDTCLRLMPTAAQAGSPAIPSQALRGVAYLAARYGAGVLISTGNMLVLTWWIGPHAYGVFVTAIGVVAFLSSVARAGVDTYLVRCEPPPSKRTLNVAWTLVLLVSTVLVLMALAAAPLLLRWWGAREFLGPYLALLLCIPLTGLAGVPTAKLERALSFGPLATLELAGQLLGLFLSFLLALRGCGVWAPVGGQIIWQGFLLIATLARARTVPALQFDRHEAWAMLRYGLGLTASLRTWQLRTLVNPLLVVRIAGAEGVAYVAFAIRIAEALGSVRLAAGRLAIASLARLQDYREHFRAALEHALFLQVVTLGPLLCVFAVLGRPLLLRLVGVRWLPSLQVYPFVAAGVLVNSVYNLQASALFVLGRPWLVMRSYLAHTALLACGSAVLLPRFGIAGYGWAELLACAAYAVIQVGLGRVAAISYRRLFPIATAFLLLLFAPLTLPWTLSRFSAWWS